MAFDTTELSVLTNPTFAGIVSDAILGVEINYEGMKSLEDLARPMINRHEFAPVKDEVVISNTALRRINKSNVDVNGTVEVDPKDLATITEVYKLPGEIIISFDLKSFKGYEWNITQISSHGYIPTRFLGTMVGNKLQLSSELIKAINESETAELRERNEQKRNKVRDFLRGPSVFAEIGNLSVVAYNPEKLVRAESAFSAYEQGLMMGLLGSKEHININQLKPGRVIVVMPSGATKEELKLLELVGITTPDKPKRQIVYREIYSTTDNGRKRKYLLRGESIILPYGDANFYLGRGRVYKDIDALNLAYSEKVSDHKAQVNTVIKGLLAQHLGVSLEEA